MHKLFYGGWERPLNSGLEHRARGTLSAPIFHNSLIVRLTNNSDFLLLILLTIKYQIGEYESNHFSLIFILIYTDWLIIKVPNEVGNDPLVWILMIWRSQFHNHHGTWFHQKTWDFALRNIPIKTLFAIIWIMTQSYLQLKMHEFRSKIHFLENQQCFIQFMEFGI